MKSYILEFNGSGEVSEGCFPSDMDAESWAESVLEQRGYCANDLVSSYWDAYGPSEVRMLFWADEETAQNDPGVKSICSLQRAK